jgi:hypothetical protein
MKTSWKNFMRSGLVALLASLLAAPAYLTAGEGKGDTRIPLTEMRATTTYKGFHGGLYEDGSNEMPADHRSAGVERAARVQPLDAAGKPSREGKIVFLGIGMSNAWLIYTGMMFVATQTEGVNRSTLSILNGGEGAAVTCFWSVAHGQPEQCPSPQQPINQYDRVKDAVLAPAGATEEQVQAIWILEANARPGKSEKPLCDSSQHGCKNDHGTEAIRFENMLGDVMRAARQRYPNLQMIFISSREDAGFATAELNPEPFAYEYGYSVKWLIDAQIQQMKTGKVDPVAGDLKYDSSSPWLAWGPYFWANGPQKRVDGLVYTPDDFNPKDLTHPSREGQKMLGTMMVDFFMASPFTPWFRAAH